MSWQHWVLLVLFILSIPATFKTRVLDVDDPDEATYAGFTVSLMVQLIMIMLLIWGQ